MTSISFFVVVLLLLESLFHLDLRRCFIRLGLNIQTTSCMLAEQSLFSNPMLEDSFLIRIVLKIISIGRQRGRVVRVPDFESGGRGFESRSDHLAGVVSW